MRKSIYKRKKSNDKKPTEAVKKANSRGNYKGGKPKSTISETVKKLDGDKVPSKNKRGEAANKEATRLKKQEAEVRSTMKKTARGLRPTEATRKLRAKIAKEKEQQKGTTKKKTNRVPTSKAPTKKVNAGTKIKTPSSETAKAAVGKKKATEAVAEVVKKQKEKRVSPTEKVYTDKEGKKYKKVRTTASKVRGGGMKYRRKYM